MSLVESDTDLKTDTDVSESIRAVSKASWRRRWGPLLVLFCAGGLSAMVTRSYLFSRPSPLAEQRTEVIESLPQASLSPEQVVRAQVESMRQAVDDPEALLTCYSFASPSNRHLTGPFERFAKLVNTEPYRQIGVCQDFQIGHAVIDGTAASVLVSTLANDGRGLAFMFLLGKQQTPPYRDCWMTDGVFPLLEAESLSPQHDPLPASGSEAVSP